MLRCRPASGKKERERERPPSFPPPLSDSLFFRPESAAASVGRTMERTLARTHFPNSSSSSGRQSERASDRASTLHHHHHRRPSHPIPSPLAPASLPPLILFPPSSLWLRGAAAAARYEIGGREGGRLGRGDAEKRRKKLGTLLSASLSPCPLLLSFYFLSSSIAESISRRA